MLSVHSVSGSGFIYLHGLPSSIPVITKRGGHNYPNIKDELHEDARSTQGQILVKLGFESKNM